MEKYGKIKTLYRAGDLDACLGLCLQFLEANPESLTPLEFTARVYSKRREPQLAKPYWHQLTTLCPDWPEPFLQSARIARRAQDWQSCARYIDQFIHLTPDHAEALGLQIQSYLNEGDTAKTARAIAALSYKHPEAVPPLAISAAEHGMGVEVAQALSQSSQKLLRSHLARALRDAAIGFEIRKQPFAAANCYQAMQIYTPDTPYPTTALSRLCRPYLDKAQAATREKSYAEALKHAQTCLKISPREAEPQAILQRARKCLKSAAHEGPA